MAETYLSDRQLGARWGVHHLTPRRWLRTDPTFPRPVRLTPGCVRWRLTDIEAWEIRREQSGIAEARQSRTAPFTAIAR